MNIVRAQGLTLALLAIMTLSAGSTAAYPVDNTATIQFTHGGISQGGGSNTVTVAVNPSASTATVEFIAYHPDPAGSLISTTDYSTIDPAAASFLPILPQPAPGVLSPTVDYTEGELVVVRITDADQNLDPAVIDTTIVRLHVPASGDTEILRLYEEAPDSGIFIGYIYAGTSGPTPTDGYLTAPDGCLIELTYDDNGTALIASAPVTANRGPLWLQITTPRHVVGAGDFVPYSVSVENVDQFRLAPGVTMLQLLPAGFSYRSGTARLDGVAIADPLIAPDGRTLTFGVGDMSPGTTVVIDFIAAVSTATPGDYPSTAQAADTVSEVSNEAGVTVLVRDELFTNRAFLAGRVIQLEECGDPESAVGVPGVRIFLEDGTFVITDQQGRYHIEGIDPGTHVAQLDPMTVPAHLKPVLCEDQTRFAGTPSSRFVDLQGGTLWQADFYLAEDVTEGEVSIRLDNRFGSGDSAIYTVQLSGRDVAIHNRKLDITIPNGVIYLPGSTIGAGAALADPVIDGKRLTYLLKDPVGDWNETIEFRTIIDNEKMTREMRAQASLTFDTDNNAGHVTPESESVMIWMAHDERQEIEEYLLRPHFDTLDANLSPADIAKLDKIATQISQLDIKNIIISGHTDSRRILWREGIAYKDNYELSRARADAIADRLAVGLDLDPDKIVAIGHAATVPIADNETEEGRYLNRRTELKIYHLKRYPVASEAIDTKSGERYTVPTEFRPADPPPPPPKPELGILSLRDGQKLAHSLETVRVRLDARLTPQLLLDGEEIPANRIGFTLTEEENKTRLLSYIGVDFGKPGSHRLQLKGIGPFGNARFEQSVRITRTGPVERIEVADTSGNLADGRTPIRLQVNLYDAAGERIEAATKLELRRGELVPRLSEKRRLARTPETGMVTVDTDGIALFDPVDQSGRYPILLGYGEAEVEIEIHVKPEKREWILVGLGDGTIGYNNISGNVQPLPDGVNDDFYTEGRIAFFARGQIKGEWLLTLAYDSDKENRKDRSLHQVIDPDSYYTLYGDSTQQGYAAASAEKLFVRIEKDRFYAVFGDINTSLTTTELSRYNRSLTGLKSEYAGNNYGYSAFVSETAQAFIKDEIRGDGTSGLYRLSRTDLVINSEKIVIEIRDRYHSEQIVASRSLQRHVDYNIDYANGTLFFKEPIASRDADFNPITIVVDYETYTRNQSNYDYGGRGYLRTTDRELEFGASYIHSGQSGIQGNLYGADLNYRFSEATRIRAEYATSSQDAAAGNVAGDVWLTELRHNSADFDLSAYYREQQAGFGLGQQNGSETGTRKYGAEADYRLSERLAINAEGYQQDNLTTDARRLVASAGLDYVTTQYKLTAGLRHTDDRLSSGTRNLSEQAMIGADWYATKKLTFRARHEQSFGDRTSSDYPSRSLLGADYLINRSISAFANQEFTFADNADTSSSRIGLRATPWDGFQARTSLEQQLSEESRRVFANLGLTQSWQLSPGWSADITFDQSQTLSGRIETPIHPVQPPASGSSEDFTAISIGSNLRKQTWIWDNRLEFRTSDSEDRWGLYSGYTIEPKAGLGFSLGLTLQHENRQLTGDRRYGDLRFGLAWRPKGGRQIILNRLDLISEQDSGASSDLVAWRIVNRLKSHWRLRRDLNLALQYGSKYIQERINTLELSGYTDSLGCELRYDLNNTWDIGLQAATLHDWESGRLSYSFGPSLGHSPAKNLWVSFGYNLLGFNDDDLPNANHTGQGLFLNFRFKFDQNSIKESLAWLDRS